MDDGAVEALGNQRWMQVAWYVADLFPALVFEPANLYQQLRVGMQKQDRDGLFSNQVLVFPWCSVHMRTFRYVLFVLFSGNCIPRATLLLKHWGGIVLLYLRYSFSVPIMTNHIVLVSVCFSVQYLFILVDLKFYIVAVTIYAYQIDFSITRIFQLHGPLLSKRSSI